MQVIREKMVKDEQLSNDHLLQLLKMANMGWWQLNCTSQVYVCSDFIVQLLGLSSTSVPFKDFQEKVHSDYRESLNDKLSSYSESDVCKHKVLLHTVYGPQWAVLCVAGEEKDEMGNPVKWGYIKQLGVQEEHRVVEQVRHKMQNLLHQQSAISCSCSLWERRRACAK